MKVATIGTALLLTLAVTQPVWAEDSLASQAQSVIEAVHPVHMKAQIIGIEPASRTLTLKGSAGNVVIVVVSEQVTDFDRLKVGDSVDVLYKNALLLTADKVTGPDAGLRKRVDTQVYQPASGGFESARRIEILATVQKIDRKKRLVTLRGPYQTQTVEARPDIDLSGVKVGDTVHAVFVSAAAVQVTPK
ncbi:hypothetical protein [Paraburkholderia sp. GAS334]|uniref:hypothetical protein n=1 Tax=Paraburkholderia sp. GAS334 TaxID=3035131 RepID=UPI003D23DEBF